MSSNLTPLEIGLGEYMGRFYSQLVADTQFMQEYIARGLSRSIVWAPGKMIDQVDKMLAQYRKNNNDDGPGSSAYLPVMIVCMSKDFNPAFADFGVSVGTAVDVVNPDDLHERNFKVRVSVEEVRTQIAIIASEKHTAGSLARQFSLYANGSGGRRFKHRHHFAGTDHEFGAMLETIDIGAVNTQAEQDNITILLADINVRASIPFFQGPKGGEPNDGKPAPAGYPVVLGTTFYDQNNKVGSDTALDAKGNPVYVFK